MPDCLSGGTGSTPVATAIGVMTRREGRSSPKRVQAGSNPVTPASLKSEHGIAAGASGLQPDDASSTLAARSKRKSSSGQDATLPTRSTTSLRSVAQGRLRTRARVRVPPSAPNVSGGVAKTARRLPAKQIIGSAILPATSRVSRWCSSVGRARAP